jgi:hypothetical protein
VVTARLAQRSEMTVASGVPAGPYWLRDFATGGFSMRQLMIGLTAGVAVLAAPGLLAAQEGAPVSGKGGGTLRTVTFPEPTTQQRSVRAEDLSGKARIVPLPRVAPGKKLNLVAPPAQEPRRAGPQTAAAARDVRPPGERTGDDARARGNIRQVPLIWTGRLFIQWNADEIGACTGQFITPQVVVTAAHCVKDQGTGAEPDKIMLALQYERDRFSETYFARCMAVWPEWVSKDKKLEPGAIDATKAQYDYAMLFVPRPSKTGHLGYHVDWAGNYNRAVRVGYPTAIEKGETIQVVAGPLLTVDDLDRVIAMRDNTPDMSQGSSGGAWIADYGSSPNNKNYLISVTSFGSPDFPGVAFGPYIDQDFIAMLQWTANGCKAK